MIKMEEENYFYEKENNLIKGFDFIFLSLNQKKLNNIQKISSIKKKII